MSAIFAAMISVVAAGDFLITCGNLEYQSSTVKATCDDPYGNFIDTSINLASCLANVNGKLECKPQRFLHLFYKLSPVS
ncbi:hypothetical protein CGCSCA4_v006751 [Colletotrichum siamense]|uniref:Cyanovirin-N domain-containing protein n=1 Tax=Colletotrichum siamense TaxID=690259 RepID=A0A9P5K7E1_COLSI|nr:hypothetical protein CGCSCA4_v006751 [Colletotrichum siamense]KAF4860886.1 hypothetical protein CGCSCA2_v005039 [Colletotrichum siamense]